MLPGNETQTTPMPEIGIPNAPTASTPAPKGELSAELNAEIDAIMAAMDAQDAPKPKKPTKTDQQHAHDVTPSGGTRPAQLRGPRVVQAGREHRTGKVVSVGASDVFIEFGPKELGIVPKNQYAEGEVPAVGATIEVVVDKYEAAESVFICSKPGSVQKAAWEMLQPGTVVEARVTGVVNGKDGKQAGVELEVANHRAFMPASQISADRVPDLSVFVGEKLKCSVVRVDHFGKGNIVLSRRDIIDAERKEAAEKLKASLVEGQTLEGTVRKIMPFGVFVDIGGMDGLVHISDLTYDRIGFGEKAIEKHVQVGQRVNVRVLKVDLDANRISLGMKQVQGDPFATASNTLADGAEVTGRVTKIAEFGAFVEIAPGVEGLIHISELDHKRVTKVEDVVKQDQVVQVKILKIDSGNRRVSLSMKALKPLPELNVGSGPGGKKGKGGKDPFGGRTAEEILKETPALRRAREKFKQVKFKGGIA